jgi:hypothetical protein
MKDADVGAKPRPAVKRLVKISDAEVGTLRHRLKRGG